MLHFYYRHFMHCIAPARLYNDKRLFLVENPNIPHRKRIPYRRNQTDY
ncbi:MAG: hypothetical protein GX877_04740 [Bacteroidales bacterium]|nr:hypothetical protein [Bacteroidales bacterium]